MHFYGLVTIELIHMDEGLPVRFFLTGCIDPAHGVEPVERVKSLSEDFLIQVIIGSAEKATLKAKTFQIGMVLWTDGSIQINFRKVRTSSGLEKQYEKKRYLGKKKQPPETELWAISDALEVAIKETRNFNAAPIEVFTDSKATLTKVQKKKSSS